MHAFDYMFTRLICLILFVKKSIYLHLNFCVVRADGIFSDKFSSKLPPLCYINIASAVFIFTKTWDSRQNKVYNLCNYTNKADNFYEIFYLFFEN